MSTNARSLLQLFTPQFDDTHSILWMRPSSHLLLTLASVVVGIGIGFWLAPDSWSTARIVAAGIFGGVGSYMCLFINRIMATITNS